MNNNIEERRRAIVRVLMARGLDKGEILTTLEQVNYEDIQSGELISLSTIGKDWDYVLEQWDNEKSVDKETHKSRSLAEIQELKRAAWASKNITEVRQCIEIEMELLGLAPTPTLWRRFKMWVGKLGIKANFSMSNRKS